MMRIGFLVNPIAGMGGRVGLKGTDDVVDEARRRGATPLAHQRALDCLREFARLRHGNAAAAPLEWLSCAHPMGGAELAAAGLDNFTVV
ncbi:MAG: ATP-NAD kinase, partial [Gammaproteobacteria bacterium]|nr:ATP-NAD kinase [Gammaproteobacteria bacterium]